MRRMKSDWRRELRERLDELALDIERLVQEAAVGIVAESIGAMGVTASRRSTGARSRTASAVSRVRASGVRGGGDPGAKILAYVKAHPGERSEVVRAAVGIGRGQWIYALNKLISDGKIKRKGQKRASRLSAG
jgi:hypothetical protein